MNLLVTGAFAWTKEEINNLISLGHDVVFMQQETDSLPCEYSWAEGVIGNGIFLSHPIEKFTNLKYVQLTSAGFDRVPMEYVKEKGIKIYNARGVYSVPMAEFALWGVLQIYKQSRFFTNNQKNHKWEKHRGLLELYGKTVCIVGCGSVGNECAKRFKAFDCRVLGVDLKPYSNGLYDEMLPIDSLNSVLNDSDLVILTMPLTDETKNLFNKERFENMKQDSVLVNIARGGIVDAEALIDALNDKLFGAVLDVFEQEPLPADSPLWTNEKIILTPHNSFVGEGNHDRLMRILISNLKGVM